MTGWACARCNQIHTQNPHECRNCGHGIFRPISEQELKNRSIGSEGPDSVSAESTVGATQKPTVSSSPDVSVDGSIKSEESDKEVAETNKTDYDEKDSKGKLGRFLSWVRRD